MERMAAGRRPLRPATKMGCSPHIAAGRGSAHSRVKARDSATVFPGDSLCSKGDGGIRDQKEEKMERSLITEAGLERVRVELAHLKGARRSELTERIRQAILTEANPAENPAYLNAREDQAMLEGRIARLEERLLDVRVVQRQDPNGLVDIGETVRLRDLETGETLKFELVGSLEANTGLGRVSVESPIGRALLGRRQGEMVAVQAPKGSVRFKILRIEEPSFAHV
jgi:transcription elongation factor GreA